jgi:hypothetical protein
VSGQVFLVGAGFLALGWGFRLGRVLGKKHGPYPARGLLRVKNYDPYLPVALIRSSFLGGMGQDGLVGQPMIRSSSWSRCELRGGEPEVGRGGLEEACQLLEWKWRQGGSCSESER